MLLFFCRYLVNASLSFQHQLLRWFVSVLFLSKRRRTFFSSNFAPVNLSSFVFHISNRIDDDKQIIFLKYGCGQMRAFSLPSTLRIRIAFHFCCCLQVLFSLQMQWIWNCKPIKDKLYFITRTHKTKSIESFVVNVLVRFARRLHLIFSFRRNSSWDLLIQCIHWHPSYTWISFLFSEFSHLFDSNPIFPLQYQSILRNCIFFQSSWLFLGIFYQTPPPPPPSLLSSPIITINYAEMSSIELVLYKCKRNVKRWKRCSSALHCVCHVCSCSMFMFLSFAIGYFILH